MSRTSEGLLKHKKSGDDSTNRYHPKCPRKQLRIKSLFHSWAMKFHSRRYNYTGRFKKKSVGKFFHFLLYSTGLFHMGVHSEFPSKDFEILKYFCSGAERQLGWSMLDGVLTSYQVSQWYPDYLLECAFSNLTVLRTTFQSKGKTGPSYLK